LDSLRMERELKIRGEQARQALAAAAARAQTPWSFHIARGDVTAEILAAALEADLVLLGKAGWSPPRPMGLGSTALAVAAIAPHAILLVQHGTRLHGPIMAVYDGSPGSHQALETAIRLAIAREQDLTVFILSDRPERGEELEDNVKQIVGRRTKRLRCRRLNSTDLHRLAQAVHGERGGLLVLAGSGSLGEEEAIRNSLGDIENPILLIR